jgi:hypothetical protein
LPLLSQQPHSTALPSPKRYDNRDEQEFLDKNRLYQLPTSTWGDTEEGEVRDTRLLTSFSIDGEYTSITL